MSTWGQGGLIRREGFLRIEISVYDSSVHTVCYYEIISEEMYTVAHLPPKKSKIHSRTGFNKHRQPTKRVGYIAQTSRLLYLPKKNQLVWIKSWTKNN